MDRRAFAVLWTGYEVIEEIIIRVGKRNPAGGTGLQTRESVIDNLF